MNEEQSIPEKATEAEQDTSKVSFGDSTLQTEEEFENKQVNENYYEVDYKKESNTTIGDGEMRNEGTVGIGNIPEESPFFTNVPADEQDKAELRDSGD